MGVHRVRYLAAVRPVALCHHDLPRLPAGAPSKSQNNLRPTATSEEETTYCLNCGQIQDTVLGDNLAQKDTT